MILKEIAWGTFLLLAPMSERGECDLLGFLNGIEANLRRDRDRLLNLLDRMARDGPPRKVEICHQIKGPIWQCETGRLQVLWFYDEGRIIICCNGFIKKTRKTPPGEVTKAKDVHRRYFADKASGKISIYTPG